MTYDELERMVRAAAEGCCMNDAWRGRKCQYHEGYADGLFEMNRLRRSELLRRDEPYPMFEDGHYGDHPLNAKEAAPRP